MPNMNSGVYTKFSKDSKITAFSDNILCYYYGAVRVEHCFGQVLPHAMVTKIFFTTVYCSLLLPFSW